MRTHTQPHRGIISRFVYLRDLMYELVLRDVRIRYKRSVLGIAWSILNPLLTLLVFYFVFRRILPLSIPHYAFFLFIGLVAWNWFQSSLFGATGSIVDNIAMIRQPRFPAAALPTVAVTANLVNFLFALPVLFVFQLAEGFSFTWMMLYLPLIIALQFLFTLSLAYLLAAVHVSFRDTQYLLGILLMLGFYLVPIFYDQRSLPSELQPIYRFNPMAVLIDDYRAVLMRHDSPNIFECSIIALFSLTLLIVTSRLFMRASHTFVESA